jgi:hypothetical protein
MACVAGTIATSARRVTATNTNLKSKQLPATASPIVQCTDESQGRFVKLRWVAVARESAETVR